MEDMIRCLGIDIGGTSVKYGIVDENGCIVSKAGFKTGSSMNREEFLHKLRDVCLWARNLGVTGVGISCLGFVDSEAGVILDGAENLPFLSGLEKGDMIQGIFPESRSCIHNDCDCAALGELWLGAACGCRNFFCMTLGTGIGGSIVLDGQLLRGVHSRAGELGYFHYRNSDDYFEKHYSTIEILKEAGRRLGTDPPEGHQFVEMVKGKDAVCLELFLQWMDALSGILADIVLLLDIEKVIIGGGISQEKELIIPVLTERMSHHLPTGMIREVKIESAQLANDAAIMGAVAPLMK